MKATMEMHIDTTWGNKIILSVESELDNGHELTTAEMSRLQVYTLSMMVAEVRRENERQIDVRDSHEVRPEPQPPTRQDFEAGRFSEMERSQRGE